MYFDDVIFGSVEVDDLECEDCSGGIMNTFVDCAISAFADDVEFSEKLFHGDIPVRLNVLEYGGWRGRRRS